MGIYSPPSYVRMPPAMAENDLDLYADDIDQDFAQVSYIIN